MARLANLLALALLGPTTGGCMSVYPQPAFPTASQVHWEGPALDALIAPDARLRPQEQAHV